MDAFKDCIRLHTACRTIYRETTICLMHLLQKPLSFPTEQYIYSLFKFALSYTHTHSCPGGDAPRSTRIFYACAPEAP